MHKHLRQHTCFRGMRMLPPPSAASPPPSALKTYPVVSTSVRVADGEFVGWACFAAFAYGFPSVVFLPPNARPSSGRGPTATGSASRDCHSPLRPEPRGARGACPLNRAPQPHEALLRQLFSRMYAFDPQKPTYRLDPRDDSSHTPASERDAAFMIPSFLSVVAAQRISYCHV